MNLALTFFRLGYLSSLPGEGSIRARFKELLRRTTRAIAPTDYFCYFFTVLFVLVGLPSGVSLAACRLLPRQSGRTCPPLLEEETTLSGGSLGSCVDEERSKLRDVM